MGRWISLVLWELPSFCRNCLGLISPPYIPGNAEWLQMLTHESTVPREWTANQNSMTIRKTCRSFIDSRNCWVVHLSVRSHREESFERWAHVDDSIRMLTCVKFLSESAFCERLNESLVREKRYDSCSQTLNQEWTIRQPFLTLISYYGWRFIPKDTYLVLHNLLVGRTREES